MMTPIEHVPGENIDRDALRQWLIGEVSRNQAYHNHKETMAWTATAFYIPGIIAAGYSVPKISECCILAIVLFLFIVAGALIGVFVRFQFRNRWIAAGRVEGLTRIISGLQRGWNPPRRKNSWETGDFYPRFIENEIPEPGRLDARRRQVEWVSYTAIVLSTFVAIALLLCHSCHCC